MNVSISNRLKRVLMELFREKEQISEKITNGMFYLEKNEKKQAKKITKRKEVFGANTQRGHHGM